MLRQIKKILASVMVIILVFGTVSVGSAAADKLPLFTIDDINSRQGEEVTLNVKFDQTVTTTSNQINSLDLALTFDKDVFEVISISKGAGLISALNALKDGNLGVDTGGYIYSENAGTPGEVIWSLSSIDGFSFNKGGVFAIVRVKIKNASNLENNPAFTLTVTSAAMLSSDKKTQIDRTNDFASYTNNTNIELNLATLCSWKYNPETESYTLVKFNDAKATYFTVPDTYDDGVNGEHPVTDISLSAFKRSTELEEVILGHNLLNVEAGAFTGCSKLKKVSVYSPDTVINANAFYGASADLLIKCVKGSSADRYAQVNDIAVEYFGDLSLCTVKGIETQKNYTGVPVTMSEISVTAADGNALTEGVDYIVEYKDNIEIGKASVIINGTGDYFGKLSYDFDILCPYHVDDGNEFYVITAPTYEDCTLGGKSVEYCSKCGFRKETDLPPKEHAEGVWEEVAPATCTEEGLSALVCPDCGKHLEEKAIEKIPHDYQPVIIKEATCSETGTENITCTVCGDVKETHELPVVDHNKQWVTIKEATCTEDGEEKLLCTYCNEEYDTRSIPNGGGHKKSEDWIIKDATCTEPGEKTIACTVCGEVFEREEIPAKGHTPEEVVNDASCTQDGSKNIVCKDCGTVLQSEVIEKTGHKYPEQWTELKAPTCTEKGSEVQICTVCGEQTQPREIPALGHVSTGVKTITEATCTHTGKEADKCSRCNEYFNETTIEKLEHSFGEWETVVEPTCTEKGFDQRVCTMCKQASETKETAALGHAEHWVYVTRPTYKYAGTEKLTCDRCKKDLGKTRTAARVFPDLDGDRRFTSSDALLILQHATELKLLSAAQQKNADCDGDGRVNSADALIVLQLSVGLVTY